MNNFFKNIYFFFKLISNYSISFIYYCLLSFSSARSRLWLAPLANCDFSPNRLWATRNLSWLKISEDLGYDSFFFFNGSILFFAHPCKSHPDFSIWKDGFHYLEKSQAFFFFLLHRPRKKKKVKKAGVLAQSSHQSTFSEADAAESANSGRGNAATRRPLPKRPMGRANGAFVSDA